MNNHRPNVDVTHSHAGRDNMTDSQHGVSRETLVWWEQKKNYTYLKNSQTETNKQTNTQKQRICSLLQHYCLSYGAEHITCRHAAFIFHSAPVVCHYIAHQWPGMHTAAFLATCVNAGTMYCWLRFEKFISHILKLSSSNMRSFINMNTPLHLRGQTGLLGSSASQPQSHSCSH